MSEHTTESDRAAILAVLREHWPESGGQSGHAAAVKAQEACADALLTRVTSPALPLHRTEAGYPNCSTCDGGGCYDCTDPA